MMYQARIRSVLTSTWSMILLFVIYMLAARSALLISTYQSAGLSNYSSDLLRMWTIGLRYDLRIAAITVAPVLLGALIMAASKVSWRTWDYLSKIYITIAGWLICSASIGSYYYFQTFHQPFDIFTFALFEDDTKAVIKNAWDDYPLIAIAALSIFGSYISYKLFKVSGSSKQQYRKSLIRFIIVLVINILIITLLGRGSVGTFPLRRANAQVSESAVINHLTPNAIISLHWAWQDKKNDIKLEDITDNEAEKILATLGLDSIYATTAYNQYLADNPPHVVFALMESFGSNMLAFDSYPDNDMLGELRQHFEEDFLFERFVPHGNGTAPSLAALFFNSPIQNISHSSLSNIELETPFSTYKKAGYKTVFISSGNLMWRNLANYLPLQNVDHVYDQNKLLNEYPESAMHMTDWGLPDEYAFDYAQKLLEEATQPLFISILTVTNHPPYKYPSTYQPKPVSIETGYSEHAEEGKIDHINLLETFQYAANSLGVFVSKIKQSSLAEKTLIAATGDHQMRRIKAYYPKEMFLDRAVPFYLYLPDKIKENLEYNYNNSRAGSHKDIMPTLYEASLSETEYLALAGRNILDTNFNNKKEFGFNELLWIEEEKIYNPQTPDVIYNWKDKQQTINSTNNAGKSEIIDKFDAYKKLMRWNIFRQNKQTLSKQNSTP